MQWWDRDTEAAWWQSLWDLRGNEIANQNTVETGRALTFQSTEKTAWKQRYGNLFQNLRSVCSPSKSHTLDVCRDSTWAPSEARHQCERLGQRGVGASDRRSWGFFQSGCVKRKSRSLRNVQIPRSSELGPVEAKASLERSFPQSPWWHYQSPRLRLS